MPRSTPLKAIKHKPPSEPLDAKREAFVHAICTGAKLQEAHKAAGFSGNNRAVAWAMRHHPDVDARITWLLKERVKARTHTFARRKKVSGDLLEAAVKRLADIAFTDVRELAAWRDEIQTNAEGEVIGSAQRLKLRDSAELSASAASLIKGAFTKSGELRLEFHDQRSALVDLIKALKGDDTATNVTVNQTNMNIGGTDAIGAAQRVAFLISAAMARSKEPAPRIIEGEAIKDPSFSSELGTPPETP